MSMTSNDDHPTDWFTVSIKGERAGNVSLEKKSDGWIISADNLENVSVNVNNKYSEAFTSFSTPYESALIYEIDQDTVGIAVDADNNGTYETTLRTDGQEPDPNPNPDPDPYLPAVNGIYGDIDGNGKITSADALTILRASAGITSFTPEQTKIADIDQNGKITSADALAVLRHSAGLSSNENIGKSIDS